VIGRKPCRKPVTGSIDEVMSAAKLGNSGFEKINVPKPECSTHTFVWTNRQLRNSVVASVVSNRRALKTGVRILDCDLCANDEASF